MGLIFGLEAAASSRQTIVGALLIVAVADNLTDSLSVHIYQEAERLQGREALFSTLANFATRLVVALSFVGLAALLPRSLLLMVVPVWGFALLAWLTYLIARARGASVGIEMVKHFVVALLVLGVSRWLGTWISGAFG